MSVKKKYHDKSRGNNSRQLWKGKLEKGSWVIHFTLM
jgi:hypothetical protein